MSVTSSVVEKLLTLTGAQRIFTYPGSPPRYVYEAVEEMGKEIETSVREQHLLHLAQTQYFRTLEQGEERIPVVVVSADLGEAMLSQPLLAGSVTCPCVVIVAEEAFPHIDNSINIAHQTDRATTYQKISDTGAIQRHENVADRVQITDETELEKIDELVETVETEKDVGVIHLPLYAEHDRGRELEDIGDNPPTTCSICEFQSLWNAAEQPMIIVGRGIRHPETRQRIQSAAVRGGFPIATTLQMDGYFDSYHVGRIGTLGTPSANEAFYQADLVVTLGASMNNLLTSYDPDTIREFQSKTVQVDPNSRRRSAFVDTWLLDSVNSVVDVLRTRQDELWFDSGCVQNNKRRLVPENVQALADAIREYCPDPVVTLGVGNAMIWMTYALGPDIRKEVSRSGSMGETVSGLKWGETPILVLGDGEFEMDVSLLTAAQHQDTSPVICVVNNDRLGLVNERQETEFGRQLTEKVEAPINYAGLEQGFSGVESFTTENTQEVDRMFKTAVSNELVSVIEVKVNERLSDDIFDISSLPRIEN